MAEKVILAAYRLNLGILGFERDMNPKLLSWKWNGRIYGGRAWFTFFSRFATKIMAATTSTLNKELVLGAILKGRP